MAAVLTTAMLRLTTRMTVLPRWRRYISYVTATLKGRSGGTFALKQGNAQSGKLQTTYDGARPGGYAVMQKQGAIILGIGGDNSNGAIGSFYEGIMVSGNPSDDVDDKVQANIVAAGYGNSASA
ncbi:unnamed protein product [Phytophthora fragariaefolia]|uniref:Unnamed protein product n=1 Tax=Phytophthora fragariaefolia TaxID=1490495 RepID=A0A9W6TYE8_9STRA|nr:unnamed protein product [Phytophthora fragariaefolia]